LQESAVGLICLCYLAEMQIIYTFLFRYEILYKQSVTTEDMFLQMGNKTPSTASCEDMVVSIGPCDTVVE